MPAPDTGLLNGDRLPAGPARRATATNRRVPPPRESDSPSSRCWRCSQKFEQNKGTKDMIAQINVRKIN